MTREVLPVNVIRNIFGGINFTMSQRNVLIRIISISEIDKRRDIYR